ncbi:MAG: porin [Ferruginibacter sp.]
MLSIYKKFDHLRFSGYIQPQFQLASSKGVKSFEGGDFGPRVSNRFMLRRSRVRIDYVHFEEGRKPGVQFVFQFDANERGFTVRDVWGRIFENRYKLFSLTAGMFARPFGFETNLSSSDRESPERGRMNQLLMRSERDLGAMISFDVRKDEHKLKRLKIDLGVFNGQGITANGDFDNNKDIIGRISLKPLPLTKKVSLAAGASVLWGGLENNTRYHYTTVTDNGISKMQVDSSIGNIGKLSQRRYFGADLQLKIKNRKGYTQLRAEVIAGKQSSTAANPETPTALLTGNDGFYTRKFSGAYFYLLQNIFSEKHQLIIKYDWYDGNSDVKKTQIGVPGTGFTPADIRYNTLGNGVSQLPDRQY